MRKHLKITYSDGHELEVLATPRAQVQTERKYGQALDAMTTMEQVYFLAWSSLRHKELELEDFEAFLNKVDEIAPLPKPGDKKQHNPTPEAALPAGSSSSA